MAMQVRSLGNYLFAAYGIWGKTGEEAGTFAHLESADRRENASKGAVS